MALIEINRNPSRRELRLFSGIWLPALCAMVGAAAYFKAHAPSIGVTVWILGGVAGLLGLMWPRLIRPIFIGLSYATYPIGWVVSHVLLAVIYYAVITPIGFVLRLSGRDPLQLRRRPGAETWWVARDPETKPDRYFRQY